MFEDFPFIIAFLGGVLSFLSPCVLPLIPAYLSYIAGVRFDELNIQEKKNHITLTAFIFVLGFSTVFIGLGAAASSLSHFLKQYQEILSQISAGFLILMGLHIIGLFKLTPLYKQARFDLGQRKNSNLFFSYLIGLAFGFGWTPCIGPILAGILTLAANAASFEKGVILLVLYAAGLGIPFIFAARGVSSFLNFSQKVKKRMRMIEITAGLLLIGTGILLLQGTLQQSGYLLLEYFPFLEVLVI